MAYFIHADGRFAILEDINRVAHFEQRGYRRCSYDELRAAWRQRDEAAIAVLWPDAPPDAPPNQEQTVGEKPKFVYPGIW